MNAIGILEQQQANEVLRLEIAYSNLYKAYMLGDRNKMISHYIATGYIGIPNCRIGTKSDETGNAL